MKKGQSLSSDTSIPDPLNSFMKKIEQEVYIHKNKSRVTAKEMLTILHSNRSQLGCLPRITISGKCDEMNNEIKKTSKDNDDNDRKVDETLTKVCNKLNIIRSDDTEEKMLEEESETLCSISLTDEVELSFDGKWLRKYFKLPLKMGIKEIVARKPCDPVTYLGFWLLNYRRCQECRQWQLEKDNKLNYLRSMIEEPQGKDLKRMFQVSKEEEFSGSIGEEEEEEEGMRDWNFKRYETMHA